ncbi:MAG: tripartite tricarboxylate transporter substrate-binding protein [Xanthobacteraceae bacterium]
MRRREFITQIGGAAAWPLLGLATIPSPPPAFAFDYPTRPIRLIVGFTPGASSDIVARLYAKAAGSIVGQEMIVENKTGAGSSIAAGYVAHASNDGYTLLVPALSTLTYKIVHPEVPFNMANDFAPVALLASGPLVMAVDPKLGVNTVKEFTALAKSKPGQILFGTVGPGSLPDLCGELYAQRAGVKLVQVPYPGSPQITTDLIGSRVMMSFQIASAIIGQVKAGQIKALAVATDKRSDLIPDVPTLAEAGMPDFNTPLWFGLLAPAGTPRPVIDKLAAAAKEAMHAPDTVDLLRKQGFAPEDMGPDRFGAFIKSEIARWSAVVSTANIKE